MAVCLVFRSAVICVAGCVTIRTEARGARRKWWRGTHWSTWRWTSTPCTLWLLCRPRVGLVTGWVRNMQRCICWSTGVLVSTVTCGHAGGTEAAKRWVVGTICNTKLYDKIEYWVITICTDLQKYVLSFKWSPPRLGVALCTKSKLWDFSPEIGVGLVLKRGSLLTLAYYAFPRWYEFGERRWNDIDRGNWRTRRKTCLSATLSTTDPTWINPGSNPGLRGERPANNDLSHGTVLNCEI
jgi:hypothetical protein